MEEVTCYALQESYLYSVTEQNANFSEELQDEVINKFKINLKKYFLLQTISNILHLSYRKSQ